MQNPMMVENAELYRMVAKRNRERGGSSAKVYKTTADMLRDQTPIEKGSWAEAVAKSRHLWQFAKDQAKADYDWSARLEFLVMEDGNAIPF